MVLTTPSFGAKSLKKLPSRKRPAKRRAGSALGKGVSNRAKAGPGRTFGKKTSVMAKRLRK